MAELLMTGGWADPRSLPAYLRDTLPDHFVVVGDTTLWGETFDAIVVGPDGLLIVDPVEQSESASGQGADNEPKERNKTDGSRMARMTKALRSFLRDEFPTLVPSVDYLQACREQVGNAVIWRAADTEAADDETLSETIARRTIPPDPILADEEDRYAVGISLRDRRLTASQRASRPFVFRSGNLLRSGSKVWTIRAAVKHMDRHPEDGIHHLSNGTLAQWLAEEGAEHLAELAMNAVHQAGADRKHALETFLVGTGLVKRPPVVVLPELLDLGYILSGERRAQAFRIRRGTGHTSGEIEVSEPWMRVEPRSFKSSPVEGVVTVDTTTLLINPKPYETAVTVTPQETGESIAFRVRFRVVAAPSPLNRFVLRPLAGMALSGLVGAIIGMGWGLAGIPTPSWLASLAAPGPIHGWGILIGLIWALLGLLRGLLQPPAWPIRYAAGRWLVRAVGWASGFAILGMLGAWCWREGPAGALFPPPPLIQIGLICAALGIVPTLVDADRARRHALDRNYIYGQRPSWRPVVGVSAGAALLISLLLAPRLMRPTWQRLLAQGAVDAARTKVEDGWDLINAQADDLLEHYYLRYYDRRAPSRTATGGDAGKPVNRSNEHAVKNRGGQDATRSR